MCFSETHNTYVPTESAVPESDDRNKIDNNTPTHLFAELRPGYTHNTHILFTWPALVTLSSYPGFDSLYIMLLIMNPFYEGTRHGLRLVGSGEEDDLDKYINEKLLARSYVL